MLGGDFSIMDYFVWNEIPTVIGNLVGGLVFVGLTLYATHARTKEPLTRPEAEDKAVEKEAEPVTVGA